MMMQAAEHTSWRLAIESNTAPEVRTPQGGDTMQSYNNNQMAASEMSASPAIAPASAYEEEPHRS